MKRIYLFFIFIFVLILSSCGVSLDTVEYDPPYTTTYYVGTTYYSYPPSYWYGSGYRWRPAPPPPPKPIVKPRPPQPPAPAIRPTNPGRQPARPNQAPPQNNGRQSNRR